MLLSSEGLVLQSIKYGDSSVITKVFSKEKGLLSLISNRPKSKKSNKHTSLYQAFNLVHFVCYYSQRSEIHRVKEVQLNARVQPETENVSKNALKFFLAEFIAKVIREEEQNLALYRYLENKAYELSEANCKLGNFHIRFLIDLLEEIGIHPQINAEDPYFDLLEGTSSSALPSHPNFYQKEEYALLCKAFFEVDAVGKKEKSQLLQLLLNFYDVQLGGGFENLKSKSVLEVVFS